MRILHTSDWHLGRTLEGRSRFDEQQAFVDELCDLVAREGVHLVVIAGDVYDTANPPAQAEELYYEALSRLADHGRRAVVVIAGNHDQPDRLCAAGPLAHRHGITLLGRPADAPGPVQAREPGRVARLQSAPGVVELAIPGCDHPAVVVALPYPSEARLDEVLAEGLADAVQQPAYDDRVRALLAARAAAFRPDAVRLATSHLFVHGGRESDSERQIQLGGACAVSAASLPGTAQYVALGHLHRPQAVDDAPTLVRYSGSPLAYGFSEVGYAKSVVLLDVEPGDAVARAQTVPLSAGRPLACWRATGGLPEVHRWLDAGRDPMAWIDLELHLQAPLTLAELQALRQLRPGFVHIRPVLATREATAAALPAARTVAEQFVRFWQQKQGGAVVAEPDPELVRLFLELVGESAATEAVEEVAP